MSRPTESGNSWLQRGKKKNRENSFEKSGRLSKSSMKDLHKVIVANKFKTTSSLEVNHS